MAALFAVACGCRNQPNRAPVIAEAYVGPAVLKVRSDIPLDSPAVATAKHGERVEIVQRRRKFLRIRTAQGAEGWTEERQLLGESDMAELRELAARSARMPSQGVATTYRDLNVHTQPAGGSPSFLRVKEGERFNVLAQVLTPRTETQRKPLIAPPEKKKPVAKKPKKEPKVPPPPMPLPPSPPPNWLDLSKTNLDEDESEPEAPEVKPPIPTDYWSLIRTQTGQSGWVLTRLISMAIPDDVAQYAEGHRIVSYLPLGYVEDGDQKKPIWLWTTIRGREAFDFDSFRVFMWSLRRHRYETAYIERNVRGYWPVLLNDVDFALGKAAAAKYPGFSVCLEKADGQKSRREYALLGNVVRYAGERPCELPPPVYVVKSAEPAPVAAPAAAPPPPPSESLAHRMKERVKGWFQKAPKAPAQ